MLVLDSILAAGSGRSPADEPLLKSAGPDLGLRKPSTGALFELEVSEAGGGAAGNRKSGMGFEDVRDDLRGTAGLVGPRLSLPLRILPNLSGGYEAL